MCSIQLVFKPWYGAIQGQENKFKYVKKFILSILCKQKKLRFDRHYEIYEGVSYEMTL